MRSNNPVPALIVVALTAIALLIGLSLDDTNNEHPVPINTNSTMGNGTMPEGPEPIARATHDAFVEMGMMESPGARNLLQEGSVFNCAVYKRELCEGADTCDLLIEQQYSLCTFEEDEAMLQGPISQCVCSSADGDAIDPEDQAVLDAVAELGYEHEEVDEEGNALESAPGSRALLGRRRRRRSRKPWSVPRCRARMCRGGGRDCLIAKILRKVFCRSDGQPKNPNSQLALAICDKPPEPPATLCEPGATFPLVFHGGVNREYYDNDDDDYYGSNSGYEGDQVGNLQITQGASQVNLHLTSDDVCFKKVKVYAGTTRPGTRPAEYSPVLPGTFPTTDYSLEIDVTRGSGPATFSYGGFFPFHWNHPHSTGFDCEDNIYLLVWAKVQAKNADGSCPALGSRGWRWSWAKTDAPMSRYNGRRAEGYLAKYRFCCQGACCQTGTCVPDVLERDCAAPFEYQGNFSSCAGVQCPVPCDGAVTVSVDSSIPDGQRPQIDEVVTLTANPSGGSGDYTYQWFENGIAISGETAQTLGVAAGGSYTVVVSDVVADCGAITSDPVVVSAPCEFTVDIQSRELADPGVTLTAARFGGVSPYTYQWTVNGQVVGTSSEIEFFGAAPFEAMLTVTDGDGCNAEATFSLQEYTCEGQTQADIVPSSQPNQLGKFEFGASVSLTAQGSGGSAPFTYVWNKDGDFFSTEQTISNLEMGSYEVIVASSDPLCGVAAASFMVMFLPDPNCPATDISVDIVASETEPVPEGTGVTLTANTQGGTGNPTIEWVLVGGASNPIATGVTQITVSEPGVYEVKVTDADNRCGMDMDMFVYENLPKWCCENQSGGGGIASDANPGGRTLLQRGGLPPPPPFVCVESATNPADAPNSGFVGCQSSASCTRGQPCAASGACCTLSGGNPSCVEVTDGNLCEGVNPVFSIDQTCADVVCPECDIVVEIALSSNGLSLAAQISGDALPRTITWSGPGGFTSSTQLISPTVDGSYTVVIENTETGCVAMDTIDFVVPCPTPISFSFIGEDTAQGSLRQPATLQSGFTFAWDPITPAQGQIVNNQLIVTQPGSYGWTLSVTGRPECPATTGVIEVDNVVCGGGPLAVSDITEVSSPGSTELTVNFAGGSGSPSFSWAGPGGLVFFTQTITVTVPGTYTVQVDDGICGSEPATIEVVIAPVIGACCDQEGSAFQCTDGVEQTQCSDIGDTWFEGLTCADEAMICENCDLSVRIDQDNTNGVSVQLTAVPLNAEGAVSYSWVPSGETAQTITILNDFGMVEVIATDEAGCVAAAMLGSVDVPCDPGLGGSIDASSTSPTEGDTVTLTAQPTGGVQPYSYLWSTGATTASIDVTRSGTYTVVVSDAAGCPTTQSEITIEFEPACDLAVTVAPPAQTINSGDSATLTATPTGGNATFSYLWSTGETTQSITVNPTADTTYTVTVTGSAGCDPVQAQGSVTVQVMGIDGYCCECQEVGGDFEPLPTTPSGTFCSSIDRSSETCGTGELRELFSGGFVEQDIPFVCVANTNCDEGCVVAPAPPPTLGACCSNTGSCFDTTATGCAFSQGIFAGEGVFCQPGICLLAEFGQACCIDNLSQGTQQCQTIAESDCQQLDALPSLNAQSLGVGTTCIDGATCPAPAVEEACCSPIGCFDVSVAFCGANGGVSQGPGTTCADTNVCAAGPPAFTCPATSVSGASLPRAADTQVSYAALEGGRVASCTVTLGSQDLSLSIADIDGSNEVTTTTVDVFTTAPSGPGLGNLVECVGVGNRLFVLLNSEPNLVLYEFSTSELSLVSTVPVLSTTIDLYSIVDVDANPAFMVFALQQQSLPVYGVLDLQGTPVLLRTFNPGFFTIAIGVSVDQQGTIFAVESPAENSGEIAKYVGGGPVNGQRQAIANPRVPIGIAFSAENNVLLVSLVQAARFPTFSIDLFDPMLAAVGTFTDATTGGSMSAPVVVETSPSSAFALAMRWPTQGVVSAPAAFIIDLTASPPTSVRVDSPGFVNGVSSISTTDALSVSSDGLGVFFAASADTEPNIFACDGAYLDSNEYP